MYGRIHKQIALSILAVVHCLPRTAAFFLAEGGLTRQVSSAISLQTNSHDAIDPWNIITSTPLIDPQTGRLCPALEKPSPFGKFNPWEPSKKSLVVVSPQLGDFDTWEYAELLTACLPELKRCNIELRFIAIGDERSAKRFSKVSGLPLDSMRVDPKGSIHRKLQVHGGPNWDIPSFIPRSALRRFKNYVGASDESDEQLVARAWLNYMAMCAGIAAPDTLPEIIRGYIGDRSAPERLAEDEIVTVGGDAIVIQGTTDVKLGPIRYQSIWKKEKGYQRPAELATVRLRGMVETLSKFNEYVPDQTHLYLRGATFLFGENQEILYQHYDTGVLSYSATMKRPLFYLEPYIGKKALNPLALGDPALMNDP